MAFDIETLRAGLPAAILCLVSSASLVHAGTAPHPVVAAVRDGNCARATELVNQAVANSDPRGLFWGGRMLDEGICVDVNHDLAASYYDRASGLGDAPATGEYAAVLGQGKTAEQGYEHAGEACKAAGFQPSAALGSYSLGYVCTLRAVASRFLRERLPARAFSGEPAPLRVEFQVRQGEMQVVSAPHVAAQQEETTGSHRRPPKVDLRRLLADVWGKAVSVSPKPDPARLDDRAVTFDMDIDVSLEEGVPAADQSSTGGQLTLMLPPGTVDGARPRGIFMSPMGH